MNPIGSSKFRSIKATVKEDTENFTLSSKINFYPFVSAKLLFFTALFLGQTGLHCFLAGKNTKFLLYFLLGGNIAKYLRYFGIEIPSWITITFWITSVIVNISVIFDMYAICHGSFFAKKDNSRNQSNTMTKWFIPALLLYLIFILYTLFFIIQKL